jgi:hypothetical protein
MRIHALAIGCAAGLLVALTGAADSKQTALPGAVPQLFETSDRCQACHNGLITPSGRDVSLGVSWRASMMAHSARDPYWQAGVRREVTDHPRAAAAIEHECSRCHMPMAHVTQVAAGGRSEVFANVPGSGGIYGPLAADGTSCAACHQITAAGLGTRASFTGHFVVDTATPSGARLMFGPYAVDEGRQRLMQSASGFRPEQQAHVQASELCATCHTLYTHALGSDGETIGELPEQVPYLEWRHSAFRDSRSCQTCHMPAVAEPVRISSAMGEPRDGLSRHSFRGGNFWMLRVLNRFRSELAVDTLPQELEVAAQETVAYLREESAGLTIDRIEPNGDRLRFDVVVTNLAGHKLPTAYPSRRVWLNVIVRDGSGAVTFESGAITPDGRLAGNDNDVDPATFESHHAVIRTPDQVQVYEAIMVDRDGTPTTGLLSGVRYVKDNRLLPQGFDKGAAAADIAVHGAAASDSDFIGGGDRVSFDITAPRGATQVEAALLYQSVGFRWARNLRAVAAPETHRFVRYYESMGALGVERLARATAQVR